MLLRGLSILYSSNWNGYGKVDPPNPAAGLDLPVSHRFDHTAKVPQKRPFAFVEGFFSTPLLTDSAKSAIIKHCSLTIVL